MTGMTHAYLFEAHTIQHYIFDSGRLADMVGASELIESLLQEPLNDCLKAINIQTNQLTFVRRGGAAFWILLESEIAAIQLRDLWGLLMSELAPGLQYSHTVCSGEDALEIGRLQLQKNRNQPQAQLPVAGPLIQRSPRTGNPAVKLDMVKAARKEWIDEATVQKRRYRKARVLNAKFMTEETLQHFRFPMNLEPDEEDAFPFESDNHYIAIVHIDGNGLGEELIKLRHKLSDSTQSERDEVFQTLSENIKLATEAAAKSAFIKTFINETQQSTGSVNQRQVLPFRPLVLGGDDLTVIIRAEYALEFVSHFINAFETNTAEKLTVQNNPHLPKAMTACAGIAFIKVNQPFSLGYQLAESLCGYAKTMARGQRTDGLIPSTLAFYRVSTSFIADYTSARQAELTAYDEHGVQYGFSLGAYAIDTQTTLPVLDHLLELKSFFQQSPEKDGAQQGLNKGALRHFLTLMHADISEARKVYKRWREVMNNAANQRQLQTFDQLAATLLSLSSDHNTSELPFRNNGDGQVSTTFIGDLLQLIAIEGEAHER